MRRALAALAALITILLWSCVPAAAGTGRLSLAYVPRTDRGTLFYLDVSYDGSLAAAKLELRFDCSLVEYRDVSAVASTSAVKARADGEKLTIVFGDSGALSGRLCRLTFKAVGSGGASFRLRMTEGVDGELNETVLPPTCELTVSVGTASGSASSSSGRESGSGKSYSGSGSSKSAADVNDAATGDEALTVRDLREKRSDSTYVVIGVAAGTCAALLAVFGYLIGRRSRQKKKPADDSGGEEAESEE